MKKTETNDKIRYFLEHRLLRDFYFEDPEYFAKTLLEVKDSVFRLLDVQYKEHGKANPYSPDQFSISVVGLSDGVRALKIQMPQPDESTLCRRIYAFYGGTDDEKAGYFCIENNEHERKCGPFLCRWLPGGIHLNYGPAHRTQEQEFLECAENYREYDPDRIEAALIPPNMELPGRRSHHESL